MAYLLATLILKFIGLLHRIMHMVLTKTFFIDWERPTVTFANSNSSNNNIVQQPPSRDLSTNTTKTEPVIW